MKMIDPRIFAKSFLVPSLIVSVEPFFVPVVEVVEFLRGTITCGEEKVIVVGVIVGHQNFSDRSDQEDDPEGEGLVSVPGHE